MSQPAPNPGLPFTKPANLASARRLPVNQVSEELANIDLSIYKGPHFAHDIREGIELSPAMKATIKRVAQDSDKWTFGPECSSCLKYYEHIIAGEYMAAWRHIHDGGCEACANTAEYATAIHKTAPECELAGAVLSESEMAR